MLITNVDLYRHQYSCQALIEALIEAMSDANHDLSLLDILKTQQLTAAFCLQYILSNNVANNERTTITYAMVRQLQPHLTDEDFLQAEIDLYYYRCR